MSVRLGSNHGGTDSAQTTVLSQLLKNLNPWAISAGVVPGMRHDHKFFRNSAVPTTGAMVSSFGGATYPYDELTAATDIIEIVSSDANDTAAGSGSRAVHVFGLDANWDLYDNVYATNGLTPVEIPAGTFKRIYRAHSDDVGSYAIGGNSGKNKGDIDIRMKTSGKIVAQMPAEAGGTLMCNYTVPAGHTAYMTVIGVYVEDSKIVDVTLYQREDADVTTPPTSSTRVVLTLDAIQTERTVRLTGALKLNEKTDLWLEAASSSTTAQVDGYYDLFLADNNVFVIP